MQNNQSISTETQRVDTPIIEWTKPELKLIELTDTEGGIDPADPTRS